MSKSMETLHGLVFNETTATIKVASTGCTKKEDFELRLQKSEPPILTIIRVKPDLCEAGPHSIDIVFSLKEIGTANFTIANLFAPGPPLDFSKTNGNEEVGAVERDLHDIWVLEWMEDHTVDSTTFPQELPRLELNPRDGTVIGTTGCNQMRGKLTVANKGSLTFSDIVTTLILCENVPEPAFLDFLNRTNGYKREGLKLTLLVDGNPVMHFKKVD
jgi:heat shock protein HslJ